MSELAAERLRLEMRQLNAELQSINIKEEARRRKQTRYVYVIVAQLSDHATAKAAYDTRQPRQIYQEIDTSVARP